jgi:hypothetical protein
MSIDSVGHGLAGAVAGAISTFMVHPFTTVTLRQKLGYYGISGSVDVGSLLASPGSLYQGVSAQCLESFMYNGINWGVYEFLKSVWAKRFATKKQQLMPPLTALVVGCIAAFVVNPIASPFKVIALQIQGCNNSKADKENAAKHTKNGEKKLPPPLTFMQATEQVIKRDGYGGFWRGIWGAQLLVVDSSITFLAFERLRQSWLQLVSAQQLSSTMSFMLGGLSKTVAVLLTYPVRMAKETLQAQQQAGDGKEATLLGVWKKAIRQRSVRGRSGVLSIFDGVGIDLLANFIKYALRFSWKDSITAVCMGFVHALLSPSGAAKATM